MPKRKCLMSYKRLALLIPIKEEANFSHLIQQDQAVTCSCSNDTFRFGGNLILGVVAVKCYTCGAEMIIKNVRFNFHQNVPPLKFALSNVKKLILDVDANENRFDNRYPVELNGKKFGLNMEFYCSPLGDNLCTLTGSVTENDLQIMFIEDSHNL